MAIRDIFKRTSYRGHGTIRGQRDGRAIVAGGPADDDGVCGESPMVRMATATRIGKLAGRGFYGPGAADAERRRDERLGIDPPPGPIAPPAQPAIVAAPELSRRDAKRRERLMRKMDDIRKRLEALSK